MRRELLSAPALLLLVIAIAAPGCSPAKRDYNKGEDLLEKFRNGDRNPDYLRQAQADFRRAIQKDPNFIEAHRSLASVDEVMHDPEAGQEYEIASKLDPTDQKLLAKARFYHHLAQLSKHADDALKEVQAGDDQQGLRDLEAALTTARKDSKTTADHVVEDLRQAVPIIVRHGEKQAAEGKYIDAVRTYDRTIQGYVLIAQATGAQHIDPAADDLIARANQDAVRGGAPQMTAKMINRVLTIDPDNQTANMELAQVYLRQTPPDYRTAAELEQRAGASDAQVKKLLAQAKYRR